MSVLIPQDKVDEFVKELNNRLPFKVSAHARPSQVIPNVINILLVEGQKVVEAYGLSETNGVIYWFNNESGALY